ncbi:hypothetical protein ACMFMG_011403 [Clarireedia jacksonii]
MNERPSVRKLRKGTRSCTECRKRKQRCSWTSDDANICRRCEERGTQCTPQTRSLPSTSQNRKSTGDRVTRLEQHVSGLNKHIQELERRLGSETASHSFQHQTSPTESSEPEESENESFEQDDLIPTQPTYLLALFNNAFISSAKSTTGEGTHRAPIPHLSTVARKLLQPLIPDKKDVITLSNRASGWLKLLHEVFPITFIVKTGDELLAQYDVVREPTVDPVLLALWLLSVALTIEHIPKAQLEPKSSEYWSVDTARYPKAVMDAVETSVVGCDRMICSNKGVEIMMLLVRLHITHGNFARSFLTLRRAIAMAELIGLPRASDGPKATLWRFVCIAERLQSLLFAFPSTTTSKCYSELGPAFIDGRAIPTNFLFRLSDVVAKIGQVVNSGTNNLSDNELYDAISILNNELHSLASAAPLQWWHATDNLPLPDQFIQYLFHYAMLRTHLPLFLRQVSSSRYSTSWKECIHACRALVDGYLKLYQLMPFFIKRIIDLQALPAIMILLLADHSTSNLKDGLSPEQHSIGPNKPIVARILVAMEQNMKRFGYNTAMETVTSIKALGQLLEGAERKSDIDSLSLTVPLLGQLNVRYRQNSSQIAPAQSSYSESQEAFTHDIMEKSSAETRLPTFETLDPSLFSWSIEEGYGTFFYELAMLDDPTF